MRRRRLDHRSADRHIVCRCRRSPRLDEFCRADYKLTFADGSVRHGTTDSSGLARQANVPAGTASVVYGLDPNPPQASVQMEVDDDFKRLFQAGA